jgi:hypothetical protein
MILRDLFAAIRPPSRTWNDSERTHDRMKPINECRPPESLEARLQRPVRPSVCTSGRVPSLSKTLPTLRRGETSEEGKLQSGTRCEGGAPGGPRCLDWSSPPSPCNSATASPWPPRRRRRGRPAASPSASMAPMRRCGWHNVTVRVGNGLPMAQEGWPSRELRRGALENPEPLHISTRLWLSFSQQKG